MGKLDQQVLLEVQDPLAQAVLQDQMEIQELRVKQVRLDHMEILARQEQREQRV